MGTIFLLACVALSGAYLIAVARLRLRMQLWRKAARVNGLTQIKERDELPGAYLDGRTREGLHVRLRSYRRGKHESGTCIIVRGLEREGLGLTLRREGLGTAFEKRLLGEPETEIGSPEFDDCFFIQGPVSLAFALLDSDTRRILEGVLSGEITVDSRSIRVRSRLVDGELEVELRSSAFASRHELLPEVLTAVLAVARRLMRPADIPRRISENLRSEPEPGFRLRALGLLAREFPDDPATREALLAARDDASDEVRLRAGIALGSEDGRETLLRLVATDGTGDSIAARAVGALRDGLPGDQLDETLRRMRTSGRGAVACACLEEMGRRGRSEAENLMLESLKDDDVNVVLAAARALGRAGTVAAVPLLLEATSPSSRAELRSAARQAIAEIQSRLPGAAPGQLSLAGGEAGALSLATSEPGQLSLAEGCRDEPGGVVPGPRTRVRE